MFQAYTQIHSNNLIITEEDLTYNNEKQRDDILFYPDSPKRWGEVEEEKRKLSELEIAKSDYEEETSSKISWIFMILLRIFSCLKSQ